MSINLPAGGKPQSNATPSHTQDVGNTRVVRMERLNKMSIEQLEAKIASLPTKLKRKSDVIEKKISQMRDKLAAYTDFKQKEVDACKRLVAEKKKVTSIPNSPNAAAAKAA